MLKRVALALLLIGAALPAWPQAYTTAPYAPMSPLQGPGVGYDPSNPAVNEQKLVAAINQILSPLYPYVPGAAGFLSLVPGPTDASLVTYGSAASVNLKVAPQGNGNIVLFPSTTANSLGLVKIGNLASWRPARGLAQCPAVVPGQAQIGMSDHITGYLVVKDWLDVSHGMPGC